MEARFRPCQDTLSLLEALQGCWKQQPPGPEHAKPFFVGITLRNLIPEDEMQSALFEEPGNRNQLSATMDKLNLKYGHTTLHFAGMLPADKLQALAQVTKRPLVFVGDGVNDAPVLTSADVGIAMGGRSSTAASESADIVIMTDDISRVATAVGIAKRTFSIAQQSIFVGIGLSIALMLIFATGKFSPLLGAVVQEAVDVVVIFNALRAHTGKI